MSRGFSSLGKKPVSANPGNYIKSYTRAMKLHSRRDRDENYTPRVKLLPSTKPIPVELPAHDTSISAAGFLATVVGITFLLVLFLLKMKA
mgnify:CR=1 FL=1|jgi:hypothetical protein